MAAEKSGEYLAGGSFEELRVHGVAGTPPESMLGLRPKLVDPPPDACGEPLIDTLVEVHEPPSYSHRVRSFSWGSLTSGRVGTVFWVLLVPYMLANVAGWMMLPHTTDLPTLEQGGGRRGSVRGIAFFVRAAGMLVTIVFALFSFLLVTGLVVFQRWADIEEGWLLPVASVAAAFLVLALFFFTRVRIRPGARVPHPWTDNVDPVGYAVLHRGQEDMWNHPGIIVRLRRLHLGVAWGLVALVTALIRAKASPGSSFGDSAAVALAWAACGLPVVLLAVVSLGDGRTKPREPDQPESANWLSTCIRWLIPLLSVAALVIAGVRVKDVDASTALGTVFPIIRDASGIVAFVFLIVVLVPMVIGWRARIPERSPVKSEWNQPALLLAGAAAGAAFGSGFAIQLERWLGVDCPASTPSSPPYCEVLVGRAIDWMAIGFTWALTALLLVLTARLFYAWGQARGEFNRPMIAVRSLIDNPSRVLALVAGLGILTIGGLTYGQVYGFPVPTEIPGSITVLSSIALTLPIVAIALWWALQFRSLAKRIAGVVVTAAAIAFVLFAVLRDWRTEFLGVPLPPTTFLELARDVAFVLPVALLLSRVLWGGITSREARKGPAVLWDLGAFWPRWFHPFAPPTYSDRAVTDLTDVIHDRGERGVRLLLAPHSQGSIIATAAITGSQTQRAGCLAMLSYGSPWSRLYAQAFPAVFCIELLDQLCDRLGEGMGGGLRWRNLYRESDPIGGPIFAAPPLPAGSSPAQSRDSVDTRLADRCHRAHSAYDLEEEYTSAVGALKVLIESCPANDLRAEIGARSERFTFKEFSHEIIFRGKGPGVILMHELPGLSESCWKLGTRLVAGGYTVCMPVLYGRPGQSSMLTGALQANFCLASEMWLFRRGETSPIVDWLRELIDRVWQKAGSAGPVGVIGMCMTGGLVLGTLGHPRVGAGVASQPSLPLPWLKRWSSKSVKEDLGTSSRDLEAAKGKPLMALRFAQDWRCPAERFVTLEREFGGPAPGATQQVGGLQICVSGDLTTIEVPGKTHSVLTEYVSRAAVPHVLRFLDNHL